MVSCYHPSQNMYSCRTYYLPSRRFLFKLTVPHECLPREQDLNLHLLFIPITLIPLLHCCSSQSPQLSETLNDSSSLVTFKPPSGTMEISQHGVSFQVSTSPISHVLWPKCMVSSTIGSYYQVLVINQEKWWYAVLFWSSLGLLWPTT